MTMGIEIPGTTTPRKMKMFYSGAEVRQMQGEAAMDMQHAILGKNLQIEALKLTSEKQIALDKAKAMIEVREEYLDQIRKLTEALATAEATVAAQAKTVSVTESRCLNAEAQVKELTATILELAKHPVTIKHDTQTALPAQIYIDGKVSPVQLISPK